MKNKVEAETERILLEDYQKFYRLAYSYAGNEADALDIVQESAYRAIKGCRKVRELSYLSTWIYRIVVNTSIDVLRRQKKEGPYKEKGAPEVIYTDRYEDLDLMDVLNRLNEKDRTIIVLRFFEGLRIEEIAGVLGENVNTVKTRLYRTLKKLRIDLEPEAAGS